MPRLRGGRLLVLLLIAAALIVFFASGAHRYLSFERLKAEQAHLDAWYGAHPVGTAAGFFLLYVAVTGLSIPGAAVLTLVAGAMFGLLRGLILVSFASALGATIAFLVSRFVLRDWVRSRYRAQLEAIDRGVQREGAFYLFTLRLLPAVPFFLINLAMGVTAMRPWTFYWVSQLGMLAGTAVYVNAGTRLAALSSPRDILSPGLIGALVLLGAFPLAAKKVLEAIRARRVYRRWPRPRRFDRNIVVIGGGSAGLVAAYIAAAVKAKVTLIEKDRMGGDCLNTGCVPSKALIRTAKLMADIRRAPELGVKTASAEVDFAHAMERVKRVVAAVEPHDSAERYTRLG